MVLTTPDALLHHGAALCFAECQKNNNNERVFGVGITLSGNAVKQSFNGGCIRVYSVNFKTTGVAERILKHICAMPLSVEFAKGTGSQLW